MLSRYKKLKFTTFWIFCESFVAFYRDFQPQKPCIPRWAQIGDTHREQREKLWMPHHQFMDLSFCLF